MKNVIIYSNKIRKLTETFFFGNMSKTMRNKRNGFGIPVVVIDLKTNNSSEYVSIAKAAKFFKAYPKTIWRKVQNKQQYKGRYLIVTKYGYINHSNIIYKLYFIIHNKYLVLIKVLKDNIIMICYILLLVLLIIIVYNIYICYIDTANSYTSENLTKDKYSLSHTKQNIYNKIKPSYSYKIKGLHDFNETWKSECILKNKSSFIVNNTTNNASIYQSIINQINLDFNTTKSAGFSTMDSINSSPIMERININNIFSNAITATRNTTNDVIYNSLELQTQGLHGNRNYVVVDGILMGHRPRPSELLNYQSNILYCIINGLSPSTY